MCLKLDGNVQNGTETTEMGGEYQIICEVPFLLCQSPSDSIPCQFISHDSVGAHETRGRTLTVFFVTVFPP